MGPPSAGFGSINPTAAFRSSGGEILGPIALRRVRAALTAEGSASKGVACKTVIVSFACARSEIPVSTQAGTFSGVVSPRSKVMVGMPRKTVGGCFLIQPASLRAIATILVNWFDSSSKNVLSVYSVPLNGFSVLTNSVTWTRDRGVFIALSLASAATSRCVESAKRCSASASRDTASAACFWLRLYLLQRSPLLFGLPLQ